MDENYHRFCGPGVVPNGLAGRLSLNTAYESLANPSNLAFCGWNLYITSLALTLPGPARISIVTAEFPGLPLRNV